LEWRTGEAHGSLAHKTMIECAPRGICSWNYLLQGDGHSAEIILSGFGEQGGLVADGSACEVRKGGWWSGEWTLFEGGQPVVQAHKPSAFWRRFELSGPSGPGALQADSFGSRAMRLDGAGVSCRIRPVHLFTRRATIEGHFEDFRVVAFAFWLTALLWRRAANSNSAGAN
jgi:hypothetical protein